MLREAYRFGRSDKKFCHAGCKDAYYNEIRSLEQREIGKINGILKRNRRILKDLYHSDRKEKMFRWEELIKKGFEFDFQTHVTDAGGESEEIIFCYDYGYKETAPGIYKVFPSYFVDHLKD